MGRGWTQAPSQPATARETPWLHCPWDWLISGDSTACFPGELCVIRSGMGQGPFLMGKWHFCSPSVLTAWKEGKNLPRMVPQRGGECQKDQEPEPQLLIFLYLRKNSSFIHFSWVERTKCLASLMPAGDLRYLLGLVAEKGHIHIAKDQV